LGLNYALVLSGAQDLTDEQVNLLFATDAQHAIHDAMTLFPNFEQIDEARQVILTDLIFNLGLKGLAMFTRFIAAERERQWHEAAEHLKDSVWFRQVGQRAQRNVTGLQSGVLQPVR